MAQLAKNKTKKWKKEIEKRIQCSCLLPRGAFTYIFRTRAPQDGVATRICAACWKLGKGSSRRKKAWQLTTKVDWLAKHLKLHQVCPAAWKKSGWAQGWGGGGEKEWGLGRRVQTSWARLLLAYLNLHGTRREEVIKINIWWQLLLEGCRSHSLLFTVTLATPTSPFTAQNTICSKWQKENTAMATVSGVYASMKSSFFIY